MSRQRYYLDLKLAPGNSIDFDHVRRQFKGGTIKVGGVTYEIIGVESWLINKLGSFTLVVEQPETQTNARAPEKP